MSQDDPMSESNGNERPIDPELISAFYDGESTAEERAAVEACMDEASDTLQTLDDYDQISQSLRQLHRQTTAPDLRASVLAQIAAAPVAQHQPLSPVRNPRRVLPIVAGLTGLAAAITLLLWPDPVAQQENMLAVNDTRESTEFVGTGAPSVAMRGAATADAVSRSTVPPPMSSPEAAALEANIASSLAEMTNERSLPKVGEVLGYLDHNADELTWVAVTVVDVQEAGDQVQLLLAKHGVGSPDAPAPEPEPAVSPDNLVTFLVEANWDQMEAVIVDLSDAEFVNSVEVDAPTDDESVPDVLQGYAVSRVNDATLAESNLSAEMLRKRVQDRQLPAAADVAGESQKSLAGARNDAVQLQLLVRGADLKRMLAARRTADAAEAAPADADAERPAEVPEIGRPLASPRAKAVIVIQTEQQ